MVTDVKSNPHISDVDLDSVEAVNELIIKLDEVFQISMPKFSLLWIQDIPLSTYVSITKPFVKLLRAIVFIAYMYSQHFHCRRPFLL
jgi:hypothetical protein